MKHPLSIFVPANRRKLLVAAAVFGVAIALVDLWAEHYISLGLLYLFPIMIAAGFLSRRTIIIIGLVCAVLDFSNRPENETPIHLLFSCIAFVGTGLFISELVRNRYLVLQQHADELADQIKRRREAEERLNILVESTPTAIVTIGLDGKIVRCNQTAQRLLAPEAQSLQGQSINDYLCALQPVVPMPPSGISRAASHAGRFTKREQQVLSFVYEGLANKEIADRIGVSESSVKATLHLLFAKTGTHTRTQLVRIALEQHKREL